MEHLFTTHWKTRTKYSFRSYFRDFHDLESAKKFARAKARDLKCFSISIVETEEVNTPEVLKVRIINYNIPF